MKNSKLPFLLLILPLAFLSFRLLPLLVQDRSEPYKDAIENVHALADELSAEENLDEQQVLRLQAYRDQIAGYESAIELSLLQRIQSLSLAAIIAGALTLVFLAYFLDLRGRGSTSDVSEEDLIIHNPGSDSFAASLDWSALMPGGANFRTHRLVQAPRGRYVMRASRALTYFAIALSLPGLHILTFSFLRASLGGDIHNMESFLAALPQIQWSGLLFIIGGFLVLHIFGNRSIFDGETGSATVSGESFGFDQVRGLQVVSEQVYRHRGGSYISHELNIVLQDKKRLSIADHGNLDGILRDGDKLAKMMAVPLWVWT